MNYLKAEVMEMCHSEGLYQIDLLNGSKEPVSYTHLEVYKRQEQRIMIVPFVGAWFFVPNLKILLPYQF